MQKLLGILVLIVLLNACKKVEEAPVEVNTEELEFNYQKIGEFYSDGILADDAHFALGELYENVLNEPEKAKNNYEKIIYNYQDSYYFPQARKNFRRLRGDAIN